MKKYIRSLNKSTSLNKKIIIAKDISFIIEDSSIEEDYIMIGRYGKFPKQDFNILDVDNVRDLDNVIPLL